MADSDVFEWSCEAVEGATSLDRLESRGTLRLALKATGLDACDVNSEQMQTVMLRVLPAEFESRGVAEGASICDRLASDLGAQDFRAEIASADTVENIFGRFGRS